VVERRNADESLRLEAQEESVPVSHVNTKAGGAGSQIRADIADGIGHGRLGAQNGRRKFDANQSEPMLESLYHINPVGNQKLDFLI